MSFTKIEEQQQLKPPIPKSYLERSRSILNCSLIIFFTILLVMLVPPLVIFSCASLSF